MTKTIRVRGRGSELLVLEGRPCDDLYSHFVAETVCRHALPRAGLVKEEFFCLFSFFAETSDTARRTWQVAELSMPKTAGLGDFSVYGIVCMRLCCC